MPYDFADLFAAVVEMVTFSIVFIAPIACLVYTSYRLEQR